MDRLPADVQDDGEGEPVIFNRHLSVQVSLPSGEVEAQPSVDLLVFDIQPRPSSVAYDQFGVEVSRPRVLYGHVEDLEHYQVHGRVEYRGRTYAIAAAPLEFDSLPGMEHIKVLLDEVV